MVCCLSLVHPPNDLTESARGVSDCGERPRGRRVDEQSRSIDGCSVLVPPMWRVAYIHARTNRPFVVILNTPRAINRSNTVSHVCRSTAHSRCACDSVTLRPGISAYSASIRRARSRRVSLCTALSRVACVNCITPENRGVGIDPYKWWTLSHASLHAIRDSGSASSSPSLPRSLARIVSVAWSTDS